MEEKVDQSYDAETVKEKGRLIHITRTGGTILREKPDVKKGSKLIALIGNSTRHSATEINDKKTYDRCDVLHTLKGVASRRDASLDSSRNLQLCQAG